MEAALISFSLVGALSGFLYFNWYPASILPGDSLTYLSGAALFSAIVLGDMEKFGVFIFLPWIAEFFLKMRSGFDAHSWGVIEDGKLQPLHDEVYSLTHVFMSRSFDEKEVTISLIIVEALIVSMGLLVFRLGYL
jgi:UDP-N-acetylglucosamine--dolichyl-phosphate N-acetylglucosaminephosphotransferase